MATPSDYRSAVELLVGIDKSSYDRSRTKLKQLSDNAVELKIDDDALKGFADGIKKAVSAADRGANQVLSGRTDRALAEMVTKYAGVREQIIADVTKSDAEKANLLRLQDEIMDAGIEAEGKAHKLRLEAAEKLKEASNPDIGKFKAASAALGDGFLDAINKAKSGDLTGLAEGLTGALSGAAKKGSEMADLASQSAGDPEKAAQLGKLAAGLGIAAGALAIVGGALAAIVAVFIAVDGAAKEFNTTLLEGAGVADFTFKKAGGVGAQMEDTLIAAQEAAYDMASAWRGQAKDYIDMVAALNQAGLTYKEMIRGAETFDEKKVAIEGYMEMTTKWSKAFGMSSAEMAEDIARMSNELGMSNESIAEQYATIATMAQMSGMGTKRFFTAVSQATAGMALYNSRMDEAAGLLLITSKVLGDTDASEFIKSLSKGFVDESYQDRYKRMILNGVEDTKKGFIASLGSAVESFAKDFNDSPAVREAFANVLGKTTGEIKLNTAEEVKDTLAGMSEEQTDKLKKALYDAAMTGDDTAKAALQQIQTITKLQAGSTGDMDAMAKGMGALTMQAKLASKMDNFMGKRLNEMTSIELMAYEQTSGLSGESLEQMMRVEDMMYLNYKAQLGGAKESHSGFLDWVASNKEAQAIAEKEGATIKTNDELALDFAHGVMDNTHSIFDVLKNEISRTLLSLYKFLIKGTDSETLARQDEETLLAMEKTAEAQAIITKKIAEGRKERDALIEAKAPEADIAKKRAELGALARTGELLATRATELEKQHRALQSGDQHRGMAEIDDLTVGGRDNASGIGTSAPALADQDLSAWAMLNNIDPSKAREAKAAAEAADAAAQQKVYDSGEDFSFFGGGTKQYEKATRMGDEASDAALKPFQESVDISDEELAVAKAMAETAVDGETLAKKVERARKKWQDQGKYKDTTVEAMVEALRKVEAEKLAGQLGLGGDASAIADILDGGEMGKALGDAVASHPALKGNVEGLGSGVAHDFISRPGQFRRFDSVDTVIGMKEGGPLASMGGGGSQHITINVNGGDPAQVYQTVKSAMKNSGARTG